MREHPQPPEPEPSRTYRFGLFTYDPGSGELIRNGRTVRLSPKPAGVLELLLRSGGELVTREALQAAVWPDPPVEFDKTLNFTIRQIRAALGDNAHHPAYIETLARRGYRFVAPLAEPAEDPAVEGTPAANRSSTESPASAFPRVRGRTLAAAAALAVLLPVTALVAARTLRAGPTAMRLAVLPFERDSSGDDPWIQSIGDELLAELARMDPVRLTVIAPASARSLADGADSGEGSVSSADLDLDAVVQGSVLTLPDGTWISVRLTRTDDGSVLWAERYAAQSLEVAAIAGLERTIAGQVAAALGIDLTPEARARLARRAVSWDARAAVAAGTFLLDERRDPRAAVGALRAAVAMDSTFGTAHERLGLALRAVGERNDALRHLERALALDPDLTRGRLALAEDRFFVERDYEGGLAQYVEARERDPGNALVHHRLADVQSILGDHEGAIRSMTRALSLDPVSPRVNGDVGRIYYRASRFDEARDHCARTLELVDDDRSAALCLLNLETLSGNREAAARHARHALLILGGPPPPSNLPAEATVRAFWEWRLAELEAGRAEQWQVHANRAQALVFLGRLDEAIAALEQAERDRETALLFVVGDPCFGPIATRPEFRALVERLGLADLPAPAR